MILTQPAIPYRYLLPVETQPEFRHVEAAIRSGDVNISYPFPIQLGRLGDGGKHRPEVKLVVCEVAIGSPGIGQENKLFALFWPDPPGGIPAAYTRTDPASHTGRHFAAFVALHVMRIHQCAVSAHREIPRLGSGILMGHIAGQPCMVVDLKGEGRPSQVLTHVNRSPSFAENLIANAIIGSGQRAETSLVYRKDQVYSQFHSEAFSYTETARLTDAFIKTPRTVRVEFWQSLVSFSEDSMRQRKVHAIIQEFYGERTLRQFTSLLDEIVGTKRFGDEDIKFL